MKKLLIVDGNSIMNRAFYGVRPLTTKDGLHSNAVFGVVNILEKQIESIKPDYAAVAYDLKAPTFRHKMYPEYKAGRHAMPDELREQVPFVKDCTTGLGLRRFELEGYEADDILGTLSQIPMDEDYICYILTGDRDALQLIGDHVRVLLAGNKETTDMGVTEFSERYGILPSQFVDVKALMGDSSDNIPGVPGIGEKTALKLIAEYGSLDGIYESIETANHTPSLYKKLTEGKESAYLSQTLARINREVPINVTAQDLRFDGINKKILLPLFEKLEFSAFIKRFDLYSGDEASSDTEKKESLSLEECEITGSELSRLLSVSPLALGLDASAFSLFDGSRLYRYTGDLSRLIAFLNEHPYIISYDSKSLYKRLTTEDLSFRSCKFDAMLASYVIDSGMGDYSLSRLALAYLGAVPADGVSAAITTYRLYEPLTERIKEITSEKLLYEIEMPLAAVLADMELCGFKVDTDGLSEFSLELSEMESAYAERIYALAGKEFNINSPKQLGEVLFEILQLPASKKTKTGYSTDAETLNKLRPYHPIIGDILEFRQVAKLRATYAEGLRSAADENGRIHSVFRQTGTATGRLSSAEPNLQNIPIRTELGRRFRKYFIPENEASVLIDADYSQIELRLLAAISGDANMIKAFVDGLDIHTSTASAVFNVPHEEVTPELRKRAKAVNFGIVYGIGDFSLAEDIGTTRKNAKAYIDSYFAAYPSIDAYLSDVIADAREKGYVVTLFGRRRYIPELAGKNKMLQHFGERVAMNSPIQGTAADIMKIAMIRVAEKLKKSGLRARLVLQVHDELLIESAREDADAVLDLLIHEMEHAVDVGVPLDVEASIGDTWYDCK